MERLFEYVSITSFASMSLERKEGSESDVPGRRRRRASSVTGIVARYWGLVAESKFRSTVVEDTDTYSKDNR